MCQNGIRYAISLFAADDEGGSGASHPVRDSVKWTPDGPGNYVAPLASDIVDHTFTVFDHRTEGEIHINKRDLDLEMKHSDQYDSYADENGDGTLEGAVYGLFAKEDIIHPDGHTDVVYQKDDLVAVATTDRNGDASFMVFTEAPGRTYDYNQGVIVNVRILRLMDRITCINHRRMAMLYQKIMKLILDMIQIIRRCH